MKEAPAGASFFLDPRPRAGAFGGFVQKCTPGGDMGPVLTRIFIELDPKFRSKLTIQLEDKWISGDILVSLPKDVNELLKIM